MDKIDTQANAILKQELGEKWDEKTYEETRKDPYSSGFTSEYLCYLANFEELSSSAKISTIVELAELDLQKGTTIPELVFSCCKWFPKIEAIESLVQLRKENGSEEELVKSILEFQNHNGLRAWSTKK